MMDTLSIIRITCFVLIGLSCLLLCILIGRRLVYYYLDQKTEERRQHLQEQIIAFLQGTLTHDEVKQTLEPADLRCLAQSAYDCLKNVHGKERDRLIELLDFLDIPDHIATIAQEGLLAERLEAIASLAYFPDSRVVAFIHTLLDDREHDVRIAAARTLIDIKSLSSVDLLFEKLDLTLGPQALVLHNTFRRLTVDVAPRLLEILAEIQEGPTEETSKVLIIETLGHLCYTKGTSSLLPLAEDPSFQVRLAFFRWLPALWIPSALPIIFKGLEDSHWQVRVQVARCVGQLRLTEAIPWLVRLVEDETDWGGQYAASCALVALGEKGVMALEALAQGTSQGREMAEMVLVEKQMSL